jgi:hypothetical protein
VESKSYEASHKPFSPSSCHVLPLRSKYSQPSILKYPQPMFYPQRGSKLHTHAKGQAKLWSPFSIAYVMPMLWTQTAVLYLCRWVSVMNGCRRLIWNKYKYCLTDVATRFLEEAWQWTPWSLLFRVKEVHLRVRKYLMSGVRILTALQKTCIFFRISKRILPLIGDIIFTRHS